MGRATAEGFAGAVRDGEVSLDAALHYHLTVNHFPPIPAMMVSVAKEAIEYANMGDYDAMVQLPDNVNWKDGDCAPVYAIVEHMHLESFIESEDE
jgi:hypothetical protein